MPTKGTTRRSVVALDADRLIADGASIYVDHIVVANNSGSGVLVPFRTANDSADELQLAVVANDTLSIQADWLADKGILVKSVGSANVIVTIFHSSPGA